MSAAMTFTARYAGRCAAECGSRIAPGDEAVFLGNGLQHAACALGEAAPEPLRRGVCDACFTERAVNGACAC